MIQTEKTYTRSFLLGILLLCILGLALAEVLSGYVLRKIPLHVGRSGVYAVFLSNGQVYFGSILWEDVWTLTLTDIYYLKLAKPVFTQEDLDAASDASLVKLGNELHGPEDRMEISREHLLFVEKLRSGSTVEKAIQAYRERSKTVVQ